MKPYLAILPVLTLLGAAPPASPPTGNNITSPARLISPTPSTCREIGSHAQGDRQHPQLKRLGELPPAQTYMSVYRTDARGCLDPMLASERQR